MSWFNSTSHTLCYVFSKTKIKIKLCRFKVTICITSILIWKDKINDDFFKGWNEGYFKYNEMDRRNIKSLYLVFYGQTCQETLINVGERTSILFKLRSALSLRAYKSNILMIFKFSVPESVGQFLRRTIVFLCTDSFDQVKFVCC